MKNICLLLMLLMLATSGCHDEETTPDGEFTTNPEQAQKLFTGIWKLTAVKVMLPDPPVPNVQMIFSGNKMTLLQDWKQIDNVYFEIVKTDNTLQLQTNAKSGIENGYLRDLDIKISANIMFLYMYNMADAPEYTFQKVK